MQPQVWAKKQESVDLSKPFAELLQETTDPSISATRKYPAGRSIFYDGRIILVGDAFCLFCPHVGSSTNQAAKHALGLAEVFSGKYPLGEWESQSLAYATKTSALSNFFGEYCFTGKVPESLATIIKEDKKF